MFHVEHRGFKPLEVPGFEIQGPKRILWAQP